MKTILPLKQPLFLVFGLPAKVLVFVFLIVLCFSNSGYALATMSTSPKHADLFSTTINSINTVTSSPTNAASVQFTVTFGANVTGVGLGNFSLTTSGVTGASLASLTGTGKVYTVTVNTGTGDGSIGLNLENSTGIAPAVSTTLPFTGGTYTIDKTIPAVTTLYMVSSNTNQTVAVVGDVITLYFGSNEAIHSSAATIGGHPVTAENIGTNLFKASYTMTSADPDGRIHFTVNFTDLAGNNSGTYNDLAAGDDVEFSKSLPSASNVSFVSNNANTAKAIIGNKVTLSFTASEAINPPVVTIAGHSITPTNTGGNSYTANYTLVAADDAGNVTFDAALVDPVNSATTHITNVTTGDNVMFNNTPTLQSAGIIASLNTVPGTPSVSRLIKVSGFNLSAGIFIIPPTGFELSTDNINFSHSVTVGTGGIVPPTAVYIRLAATDLSGTYANDMIMSSPRATDLHLTAQSSTVAALLGTLSLSPGSLAPAFKTTTTSYSANVGGNILSMTVTPRNADGVASLKVNGTPVVSGMPSQSISLVTGANTINIAVTSQDNTLTKIYTVTVTKAPSNVATLASFTLSTGVLHPTFVPSTVNYVTTVPNSITSISVTPTTIEAHATVKVNSIAVTSSTASAAIPLTVGDNVITTVVTAENGTSVKTYTLTVTRKPSTNDDLAALKFSNGALTPAFTPGTTSYTKSVPNGVASVTLTPTTADTSATVTVNGGPVVSGTASAAIALNTGDNPIAIVVTAQSGDTKTYMLTVTRALSANANLSILKTSSGAVSPAFSTNTTDYTRAVGNAVTSITITPTAADANASITVNGLFVKSGNASESINLNVGDNTIPTVVTAQDGSTQKTYTIVATRATGQLGLADEDTAKPLFTGRTQTDEINVHQGVTPNGDRIDDFLVIDGINKYPDNRLTIMNRSGQLVFESKGYDNRTKVFDGHSSKTGAMQLPGTYFYSLDYTDKGVVKHKTGFIVIKY